MSVILLAGCNLLPTTPYERPALRMADNWQQNAMDVRDGLRPDKTKKAATAMVSESAASVSSAELEKGNAPDGVDAASYVNKPGQPNSPSIVDESAWWWQLNNADLGNLIEQARALNYDATAAQLNLDKAMALSGGASAARWPTPSVALTKRFHDSVKEGPSGQGAQSAILSLEHEWDLWGTRAGAASAAQSRARAAAYERADVLRRVTRETVALYWKLAWLDERQEMTTTALADSAAEGQRAKARYEAGVVGADAPALADLEYAKVQSELASIEIERAASHSALAILVGQAPGEKIVANPVLPHADTLPAIEEGIPADVLSRRPDLQASEWLLRASYADADVARASLYPRITLTGSLGTSSRDLADWIHRPFSSLVGALTLPIVQWHQLRFGVRVADANQALAHNAFAKTFHHALKEVEDGLTKRHQLKRQYDARTAAFMSVSRLEKLTWIRYEGGEVEASIWYSQRAAKRAAASALTSIHYEQLVNLVNLYQALGRDVAPITESREPGKPSEPGEPGEPSRIG